ncbi:MAG TPA: hypothetical protein VMF90_17230, partial [Rhizobiaceae bacterium]|nr:hypothetical protein [Rhizobiaceae bacterium]
CRNGWRFEVREGALGSDDEERLSNGTKTGRGNFSCVITGAAISENWIRTEGKAGRIGARLMAVVIDTTPGRAFVAPEPEDEVEVNEPAWVPSGELYEKALGFRVPGYGYKTWASLFNNRQLSTLACFFDLVTEARERVLADAIAAGMDNNALRVHEGGIGAAAYADAVATYLALAVNRSVMGGNTLVRWNPVGEKAQHAFGRQALPMIWDYAETNLLGTATGSFVSGYEMVANGLLFASSTPGFIGHSDAMAVDIQPRPAVISTDPPYYDNVGYADLSDFFYVWLRPALSPIWPDLFRRLATPKEEELVATPQRHGGKVAAEAFFMHGMGAALRSIAAAATNEMPVAIYYAFKQSEIASEGVTSAGWSTFLQAILNAGFIVDGTWPLRTEMATRLRGQGSNALASSVVLVCRKRPANASVITRADFLRALKRELPEAIEAIRKAGVGPVDMQQSVIGPGMGVFSRYAKVLEDDDSPMSVRTALALINRVWEEIENELDGAFDPETQVALAWYASYGFDARPSGELITLTTAKNTSDRALFHSGVFEDRRGKAALTGRSALPKDWTPAGDKTLTIWECVQHTARVLNATDGGTEAAARLIAQMGQTSSDARKLAYRLFEIATQKGWSAEALVYNELAEVWPKLEDFAANIDVLAASGQSPQRSLFEMGA